MVREKSNRLQGGVSCVQGGQLTAAEAGACWLSVASSAHPCSPSTAGTEATVCLIRAPASLLGGQHPCILSHTSFPILTNTLTI